MTGSCSNGRGIPRTVIEGCELARLKNGLMEFGGHHRGDEGVCKETNRLNPSGVPQVRRDRKELATIEKKIPTMIAVIEGGDYIRGMIDRPRAGSETRRTSGTPLRRTPAGIPNIRPNVAAIYPARLAPRRGVERSDRLRQGRSRHPRPD